MGRSVYAGLIVATLTLAACGDDASEERRDVEATGKQVGEKLEEAAGELGAAAQEAGEKLEAAANDLTGEDSSRVEPDDAERADTLTR